MGNAADGIEIEGGATHTTVTMSVVANNRQQGIFVTGTGTDFNALTGDFIGTAATGESGLPNVDDGVLVSASAASNTVGGTSTTARDIISSNRQNGVVITGSGTVNNVIEGDYIGTDGTGINDLENDNDGVDIEGGASSNTIGGTTAGARDVISGDCDDAVLLSDPGTSDNVVEGDYIGPNAAGTGTVFNCDTGVTIAFSAAYNTVGGTTASARDVISGNANDGIFIYESGTAHNVIEGDFIGTDSTGAKALANGENGLEIVFGAGSNTVGGLAAADRDIISGNAENGVTITDSASNVVDGDYIGTDDTGANALANGENGIGIDDGANANTVGGATTGAGNVISGNTANGLAITGSAHNLVDGDFIGTDDTGAKALANGNDGVVLGGGATANTVGGTTAGARDVISGNAILGVDITDSGTSSNVVEGDFIGTSAAGTAAVPNRINGVDILSGATANTIGGTAAGTRDVISGNAFNGVVLAYTGTSGNVVEGDYIGTDDMGETALANGQDGVDLIGGATANTVGGTTSGALNVISGNASDGVLNNGSGTALNVVLGDYIGTDATGAKTLANRNDGVVIDGAASSNTVGGTTAGARDVISGNGSLGVAISDVGTANNLVDGDYIGTSAAGTAALPNAINGVDILAGATSNTLGGTTAGARDVIAGNTYNGVVLAYAGTTGNVVEGDYIGTDETGARALANGQDGVDLIGGATANTVGGTATGALDVISGNGRIGVDITDSGTQANLVEGDYIGTDVTGEAAVSNGTDGVVLQNGVFEDYVYYDLISANGTDGVLVTGANTSGNQIVFDSIGLDATGTKAVKQTGEPFSNFTGVEISGASNTLVQGNYISGNNSGVSIEAGASYNSIYSDYIGTGTNGATDVGNLQEGVILNGVINNYVYYDVLVYNGDVGILGEDGSNSGNNVLEYDTFTVIVNGVTYGNNNGAERFE